MAKNVKPKPVPSGGAMFEVGKDYRISELEWGDNGWGPGSLVYTVVAVEGTLIKLRNPHSKDRVVNTASPMFVSADLA